MINILLVGANGKMGTMVATSAKKFDNISIIAGIDKNTEIKKDFPIYSRIDLCTEKPDVILDFSRPELLHEISSFALKTNTPVVFCTTGYTDDDMNYIKSLSSKIAIFKSANMSIGINIINNVLKNLSNTLYKDFDIEIIEKHHNQKVDAPSGTALLLADTIQNSINSDTTIIPGRSGIHKREKQEIGIHAIRGGNIVGEHEVIFAGEGEVIEIKHSAISREVFAIGALKACTFMKNQKPGLYNMDNVINH